MPPDQFPDALPKRRRILEELPKAAPLPPPAPSAAALAEQAAKDQTLKEIVAFRLNPILTELKKRHNRKSTLTAAEALQRWYQLVARDEERAEDERQAAKAAEIGPEASLALDAAINGDAVQPMAVDVPINNPFAENNNGIAVTVSMEAVETAPAEPAHAERPRTQSPVADKPSRPKPHWVDFELMQEKLMSQDDGYYSLRAFERDIFRMRENVDGAEMDLDKRTKAALLAKEATLMIKDHFQDEQQKLEIERMAAREYAKKQLKKKKGTKSASSSPNGTRSSARLSGRAPEISFTEILENERVNGKKRSRDGSEDAASIGSDGRAAKRNKGETGGAVLGLPDQQRLMADASHAPSHGILGTGSGTHAMAAPLQEDILAGQLEQASTIAQPSSGGLAAILNPIHMRPRSTTPQTEPPITQQPVPHPHPPFFIPEKQLEDLSDILVIGTHQFTVEDLEQLHSMALQIVWRYRSDWDRSLMVKQLVQHCSRFVQAVQHGS